MMDNDLIQQLTAAAEEASKIAEPGPQATLDEELEYARKVREAFDGIKLIPPATEADYNAVARSAEAEES